MIRPSINTGTYDEMIAPVPPLANMHSQLMRVWVSDPSSLSKRPDMLERKIRFLTSRLRNRNGVKMMSWFMVPAILPWSCGAAHAPVGTSSVHEGLRRTGVPMSVHEHHLGIGGMRPGGAPTAT